MADAAQQFRVKAILGELRDSNKDRRRTAVMKLGMVGGDQAVRTLIRLVDNHHEDLIVRGRAALMLGKLKDDRAVPHLIRALPSAWLSHPFSCRAGIGQNRRPPRRGRAAQPGCRQPRQNATCGRRGAATVGPRCRTGGIQRRATANLTSARALGRKSVSLPKAAMVRAWRQPQACLLALLMIISLLLRIVLLANEGQLRFPDEFRYLRSTDAAQQIVELDGAALLSSLLGHADHPGFTAVGLIPGADAPPDL